MRAVVLVVLCGCSSIFGLEDPRLHDAAIADVTPDMGVAEGFGPWGDVTLAFPSGESVDDPTLTDDMLEMYMDRRSDIYVVTRNSVVESWSLPARVVELSSIDTDTTPEVTADGLTIIFSSNRANSTSGDIWVSTRASRADPWGMPSLFGAISSNVLDYAGSITPLQVAVTSTRGSTSMDLYWSNRAGVSAAWPAPVPMTILNSTAEDANPFIMLDGSAVYFDSRRVTGTVLDLYVATRTSGGAWGQPQPILELNTAVSEHDPWVSSDGRTMYFASDSDGGVHRIYSARRESR